MKLSDAKKLLIDTLKENESIHYVVGYLSDAYLAPQDDDTEKYVVTQTLAKYGINVEIEAV